MNKNPVDSLIKNCLYPFSSGHDSTYVSSILFLGHSNILKCLVPTSNVTYLADSLLHAEHICASICGPTRSFSLGSSRWCDKDSNEDGFP